MVGPIELPTVDCLWCERSLHHERDGGFVHADGGLYWQRCASECGWENAPLRTPTSCPRCGGRVVDDHAAVPVPDQLPKTRLLEVVRP
ncbi:MAG: hypothetical protein WD739_07525 [Actinomycetota bacterium]